MHDAKHGVLTVARASHTCSGLLEAALQGCKGRVLAGDSIVHDHDPDIAVQRVRRVAWQLIQEALCPETDTVS